MIDAVPEAVLAEGTDHERTVLAVHTVVTLPDGSMRMVTSRHACTERELGRFYANYFPAHG